MDDAGGDAERPGRGRNEQRARFDVVRGPIAGGELVFDQPVGGGGIGHPQQRLRQHHEGEPLLGGQRIGMQEVLDAAEPASAAANGLDHQECRPPTVQRREGQDVDQAQAETEEPDERDQIQAAALGHLGSGLDDTQRPFDPLRTEEAAQPLVGGQLVDAAEDTGDGIARPLDGEAGRLKRTVMVGHYRRPNPDHEPTRILVIDRGDGVGLRLAGAPHRDGDRGAVGGVHPAVEIVVLVDRVSINRQDHVPRSDSGRPGWHDVRRGHRGFRGVEASDLDRGLVVEITGDGNGAEEDQHGQGQVQS